MAKQFPHISESHKAFIENQHIFFVATAAEKGNINLSPKGLNTLKVLSSNRVIWLDIGGRGNETSVHLHDSNRMTLMLCSLLPTISVGQWVTMAMYLTQ